MNTRKLTYSLILTCLIPFVAHAGQVTNSGDLASFPRTNFSGTVPTNAIIPIAFATSPTNSHLYHLHWPDLMDTLFNPVFIKSGVVSNAVFQGGLNLGYFDPAYASTLQVNNGSVIDFLSGGVLSFETGSSIGISSGVPMRFLDGSYIADGTGVKKWSFDLIAINTNTVVRMSDMTNAFAKRQPWVSDFGPIGGADDTATFQAANDRMFTNGGGSIYVPNGYWTNGALHLSNAVSLVSAGGNIVFNPSVTAGALVTFPLLSTNNRLEGLNFYGGYTQPACCGAFDPAGSPAGTRTGIVVNVDGFGSKFSDCRMVGFSAHGVFSFGANPATSTFKAPKTIIRDLEAFNCATGFYFDSTEANKQSEYFNPENLYAHECTLGVGMNCANVAIVGWRMTDCQVGFYLGWANGNNSGHGTCTGMILNHNQCAVYGYAVGSGWEFTNLYINKGDTVFASDIFLNDCSRVHFNGGSYNIGSITIRGTGSEGENKLFGSTYSGTWSSILITNSANFTHGNNISFDTPGDTDGTVSLITGTENGATNVSMVVAGANVYAARTGQKIIFGTTNNPTFSAVPGTEYVWTNGVRWMNTNTTSWVKMATQ